MLFQLLNQVLQLCLVTFYRFSPSSQCIVQLLYIHHALFFSFKSMRILLGNAKHFVMSTTFFFSSSLSLPARKWPPNFGSNSWLWTPLSMVNHQSFVYFSKRPCILNRQSHFLEHVPSSFNFFFAFDGLYTPFLSYCNVNIGFFRLDLSIHIVNPTLAACQRIQPSKLSHSRHQSFMEKMRRCLLLYHEVWKHR